MEETQSRRKRNPSEKKRRERQKSYNRNKRAKRKIERKEWKKERKQDHIKLSDLDGLDIDDAFDYIGEYEEYDEE